jgi:hypothetical protein
MWLKVYPHHVPPLLHSCLSTFSTWFDGLVKLKCLIQSYVQQYVSQISLKA